MARFLLDTNICIYIRQRRPPAVLARFEALQPGDAVLSVVTYGELARGVERSVDPSANARALEALTGLIPVLPLPAEAGPAYGAIRVALERKGAVIGNNDLWIAAHARAAGLVLVTNNEREFLRVSGLTIENWVA